MMQRLLAAELREEAGILARQMQPERQADMAGQFRWDATNLFK